MAGTNEASFGFIATTPLPPLGREEIMGNLLYWAVIFLIVALVAAFLGFGGVAGVATEGARILFWVAIILVVLSFIGGMLRRG
jgi:uncharacterized membrane protein YtjA (UPF0391 family)